MSAGFLRWVRLKVRGLLGRPRQEEELDREMRFHVDMLVAENVAAGLSPEEARLAAQREFGGATQYQEECRDTWRPALVSGLLGDLAYAIRSLRRSPGFTAVAVFTLALGIGVNVVMFAFIRNTVLRPLLQGRELNLVSLYNARVGPERHFRYFTYAEYNALQESTEVFAGVAAMGLEVGALGPERNLQQRFVGFVSENYFSLLGAQPAQGRFFTPEECRPGAAVPVLVANHALWVRLGRPANFVGSTLRLEDRTYTVIGIAPPGFVGLHVSIGPDVWVPFGAAGLLGTDLQKPTVTRLTVFARLRPELSAASAAGRHEIVDRRLNALPPVDQLGARRLVIQPPARADVGSESPEGEAPLGLFALLTLGLSLMVLLVTCLNLANLLLARGAARHKEIAIRFALGASRWRVIRGLLAEGLLLALLGGALSLALGYLSNEAIIRWGNDAFAAGKFALKVTPFLDASLVVATLGFSLLATFAFSLWPALRITRSDLYPDLKQIAGAPPAAAGRTSRLFSWNDVPLLAQIALSLALLFSAALFVRSSKNACLLDLGFRTGGQLTAQLDYRLGQVDPAQMPRRQQALLASVATLPGVTATALSSNVPYNFELPNRRVRAVPGDGVAVDPKDTHQWAGTTAITRGYLDLLGIALLRGRDFTAAESDGSSAQQVAIIDETLARVLFGDADPLGRRVVLNPGAKRETPPLEVVGIVRSPRNDAFGRPPQRLYRPLGQAPESTVYLHVQTPEPLALVDTLRNHLQAVAPEVPVLLLRPFADFVEKNINVLLVRMAGVVFGIFGGIALVLAAVGVYGVKAHATVRRTREIGVRVALGARPRDIMLLILRQGLLQAALGVGAGLGLAVAAGRGLSAMLYHVDPLDPAALLGSAALLAAAVLLACWIPAWRATKVDPLVAIRTE